MKSFLSLFLVVTMCLLSSKPLIAQRTADITITSETDVISQEVFGFNFANFYKYALDNFPENNHVSGSECPDPLTDPGELNDNIRDQFLDLNPQIIRFPGGTLGNFYHYGTNLPGVGYSLDQLRDMDNEFIDGTAGYTFWGSTEKDYNADQDCYGENILDIYVGMMDDYYGSDDHPKVIYLANVYQHFKRGGTAILPTGTTASEFNDMFDETKDAILEFIDKDNIVIAVELGNELYFEDYHSALEEFFDYDASYDYDTYLEDYEVIAEEYADRLKNDEDLDDYNLQVGVPVHVTHYNSASGTTLDWNNQFIEHSDPFYDALIIHPYFGRLSSVDPLPNPCFNNCFGYFERVNGYFADGDQPNVNDNYEYEHLLDELDDWDGDLWMTEWNFSGANGSGFGQFYHSYINGSYVFRQMNHLLHEEDFSISTFHLLLEKAPNSNPKHALILADGSVPSGNMTVFNEYFANDIISNIYKDILMPLFNGDFENATGVETETFFQANTVTQDGIDVEEDIMHNFYPYKRYYQDDFPWTNYDYGGTYYLGFSNSDDDPITIDLNQIYPDYYGGELSSAQLSFEKVKWDYVDATSNRHVPVESDYLEDKNIVNSVIHIPAYSYGLISALARITHPVARLTCPSSSFSIGSTDLIQGEIEDLTIEGDELMTFFLDGSQATGYISNVTTTSVTQGHDTYYLNGSDETVIEKYIDYSIGDHDLCLVSSIDSACADTICHEISVCTYALEYDGSNDKTTITHNGDIVFDTTEFTIEINMHSASTKSDMYLFYNYGTQSGESKLIIGLDDGNVYFKIIDGFSTYTLTDSDGDDLRDGYCHNISVLKDSVNFIRLFVDGEEVESGTVTSGIDITNGSTIVLGNSNIARNTIDFEGILDEFRIWHNLVDSVDLLHFQDRIVDTTSERLSAYWRFDENTGQTSDELVGTGLQAYRGSSSSSESSDPSWTTRCCEYTGPMRNCWQSY